MRLLVEEKGKARLWLAMQQAYDLRQAEVAHGAVVEAEVASA
jgi:plasmid maintenance system antidote protein VapI